MPILAEDMVVVDGKVFVDGIEMVRDGYRATRAECQERRYAKQREDRRRLKDRMRFGADDWRQQ